MVQKIITYSFYLLFFLTPLVFTPLNYELFEYNKMMFVYALTVLIVGLTIIKMILERRFIAPRTPLDIPIFLFLISQILSTIFSIDPHTSLFGYYSRSNGGLLSTISYILFYYCFVINFFDRPKEFFKILKITLLGGAFVALWAIPEHFGHSLSCLFLTGSFDDQCWVQDVQARVFATLGQPNWLAAFMEMIIFPALYFFLTSKSYFLKSFYGFLTIIFYLAFIFTFSRGAFLGIVAGFGLFLFLFITGTITKKVKDYFVAKWKYLLLILVILISTNLFFGSAYTRFKLITQAPPTPKPSQAGQTQLENGGSESSQIRLIVWKGAFDIFKHYPILGSGVETFAYSYYNFRPREHNLVSEWDFLYNKAHNEYLNYLATTGILGLGTYLFLIGTFIAWSLKQLFSNFKGQSSEEKSDKYLFILSILAAYLSYLVQNIFQFSVVAIALLFYTYPLFAFNSTISEKDYFWPLGKLNIFNSLKSSLGDFLSGIIYQPAVNFVYKRPIYKKASIFIVSVIMFYLFLTLLRFWIADTHFASGSHYLESGNGGRAYNELLDAASLNPSEPLYLSQLGLASALASEALADQDSTRSAGLKDLAEHSTQRALDISPKNLSYWRSAVRAYFALAVSDPSYFQKTLDTLDQASKLAPTDPQLLYNKSLVLNQMGKQKEAIEEMKKALELKPNYMDAILTLGNFYIETKQKDLAFKEADIALKLSPGYKDALDLKKKAEGL